MKYLVFVFASVPALLFDLLIASYGLSVFTNLRLATPFILAAGLLYVVLAIAIFLSVFRLRTRRYARYVVLLANLLAAALSTVAAFDSDYLLSSQLRHLDFRNIDNLAYLFFGLAALGVLGVICAVILLTRPAFSIPSSEIAQT